jgi:hypothetical protein
MAVDNPNRSSSMMKKRVTALIAVIGLAILPLQAEQMKCGAGKCGAPSQAMKAPAGCACPQQCDHADCAHKKDPSKPCDCNESAKTTMKCGAGKCGGK